MKNCTINGLRRSHEQYFSNIRMNASIYFIVSALWIIIILTFFFRKSFAFKKKKSSSNILHLPDDVNDVFGKSKSQSQVDTFFLSADNKNFHQKNENSEDDVDEIDIDAFELEYEDEDIGLDFPHYPPDAFVEGESNDDSVLVQGMSFEDIRHAVNVVESGETAEMLGTEAVQHARRVFRMLDETELLEQMRNIVPEMSVRMEALLDET